MGISNRADIDAAMIASQFRGRRILLILPQFFGYDRAIADKLRQLGAEVALYGDRPSTTTLAKIAIRLSPELVSFETGKYLEQILEAHPRDSFDDILILKGEAFTRSMLRRLFAHFPRARKIFYMWDSFRNVRGSFEKLPLFDRVLSFDAQDVARTPGLLLRPLFFTDDYRVDDTAADPADDVIDLLFVGTVHTDRYRIIRSVESSISSSAGVQRNYYLYFPSKLVYRVRRIVDPQFWGASEQQFKFVPLSKAENAALFHRSRVILDIERSVQTGLTMRTLETLAASKKLVTTNAAVRDYDIYHPDNIAVIDRRNPVVPLDFIQTPYRPISAELRERYSLQQWLLDVFGTGDVTNSLIARS